jgi:hypothetical protein
VAAAGGLGSVPNTQGRPAMAFFMLNVAYAEQKDTSKCWLASAWMVINFSRPKEMAEVEKQLGRLSRSTAGVTNSNFNAFLRKSHFKELWPTFPHKETKWPSHESWTPERLVMALQFHGPLWCAGPFYDSSPHAVAAFGVQERRVCFHDPLIGPNRSIDIDQFNEAIKSLPRNTVLCYPT